MATNAEISTESLTVFPFSVLGGAYRAYSNRDHGIGREPTTTPFYGRGFSSSFQTDFTTPSFPFSHDENGDGQSEAFFEGSETSPNSYSSPGTVFGVLVTFSLCTIFGNSLVMLAVAKSHYLKSPPNFFVASLAAADFFVGILLVPFEAITQLLNRRWIFGEIWCDLWHSFDVLLTTASILNLCVISLDRYWAICTPLHYSRRMTPKRAFRFIALVWICSVMISLPAIFWWRGVRVGPVPKDTCPFTDDVSYLISSSCISFYIPLSVMLFAYYKIYLAAVSQSKSIQQGTKQFAAPDKNGGGGDITLRMHRGGTISGSNGSTSSHNGVIKEKGRKSISFERTDPSALSLLNNSPPLQKETSLEKFVEKTGIMNMSRRFASFRRKRTFSESAFPPEESSTGSNSGVISEQSASQNNVNGSRTEVREEFFSSTTPLTSSNPLVINITATCSPSSITAAAPVPNGHYHQKRHSNGQTFFPSVSFRRQSRRSFTVARKFAKFAKEKKAAKTLAIVLGVFIICWLPFFLVNIVFAVCNECAKGQEIVFEVVTWLGWMNSAMNPVIYACWSQDFRRAFARLLGCRTCSESARQRRTQRAFSVV